MPADRNGMFSASVAVKAADLRKVARVSKSNGTDGEVLMSFLDAGWQDMDFGEPVFILFDGLPVPFFVLSSVRKGSRLFVRFNDVDTLADAEELVGRDIFVRSNASDGDAADGELAVEDLVGWSLLDADGSQVGEITGYEDIPGNPCLYVSVPGQPAQAMVPLHDDLIEDIDPAHRSLRMRLPEGLL